ncbi:MAG TPA: hypothetical protein VK602_17695, partial [Phyllobacterium sp.]|nr:hypothetical protein [Phyllobacterium sp.]
PIYVAVVDDDESLCRSLGRLLRAAGIQPILMSPRRRSSPKEDTLLSSSSLLTTTLKPAQKPKRWVARIISVKPISEPKCLRLT